ncbi:MAG TPA: cyclic nucleotide-binding domain-containing protein [Spirochaetota bacterium]|nr:cyclic nucleotide-binding domain-containing protein [Spirochaetota bacterium]
MDQKINYSSDRKNYPKSSVIILQGSSQRELYFLNEGTIELKRCGENTKGFTEKEILSKSKRIGIITGPSIFGVENLLNSGEHHISFVTISECIITKYSVSGNDYLTFFKNSTPIAMNILLTMKDYSLKTISNLRKYVNFISEIERATDNFELVLANIENNKEDKKLKKFLSNGGVIPSKIDTNFFINDFSTLLGKTYGEPSYDPVTKFGFKKLEFYHNILKTKPDAFISIMSTQFNVFIYLFDDLSLLVNSLNIETEKFVSKIDSKLNSFFYEEYSPFNRVCLMADKIKSTIENGSEITKAVVTICRNLDHINKQLNGREHTDIFPKYDMLSKDQKSEKTVQKPQSDNKYIKMYANSCKIIADFSDFPGDKKTSIIKNVEDMKKINFSDPSDKESRTIIRKQQQDFYELYLELFLKYIKNPMAVPPPVKLFLYYGFIEEKFMTEEQMEFLHNSINFFTQKEETDFPIITMVDYLTLIYNEDEAPGLSAVGEDFNKIIRRRGPQDDKNIDDSPKGRVYFELNNMLREGMRITSDNPRAAIPYLNEQSFKGQLNSIINNPKKIDAFIKKINSIDIGLFYRELTWKIPGKSELIKKEVKPYIILVPNTGIRVQLWQEMINNIRSSRGRFLVPIFFNGDLNKSLVLAFAYFRWELNKQIVGANWMDPVEGGFVGSYYDYTQYYHKMSELSMETKEEIKILFNKIKIDRDRFAHDYNLWVSYEKEGIPKCNKVVRAIFYRYIPFPKDVRERLKNLPLFEEIDNKFNNIRNREFKSLEAKFHKYAVGDKLPDDLEDYLNLLKR